MIDRRHFIGSAAGALLCAALPAIAQRSGKLPRLGYLSIRPGPIEFEDAFLQGLREFGHINGSTIIVEFLWANGDPARAMSMAAELLKERVDIVIAPETSVARVVKELSPTVPIVMPVSGDPVAAGLAQSFSRPGGSVTGLSLFTPELTRKRLEIFKSALPGVKRAGALYNVANRSISLPQLEDMSQAAAALGMTVAPVEIELPGGIAAGFAEAARRKIQGVIIISDVATITHRAPLGAAALANRLPTMFANKLYLKGGGLMSYGPDILESFRRSASFVDRILKGAKPGDLPIEQPTRLELAISLKTAGALGITIAESVLQRADVVIR